MDIIIFAIIAGVFFYKLYNMLGQTDDNMNNVSLRNIVKDVTPENSEKIIKPKIEEINSKFFTQIKRIQIYDPNFSEEYFMNGAIKAYELILDAFNKGDLKFLQYLLSEDIYSLFSEEIARNAQNAVHVEKVILSISLAEILDIKIHSNNAVIEVKYSSQQMIIKKNIEGEVLNSETVNVQDIWKFTKDLTKKDLNWRLINV
ncbi:MAG: Tim44/TimA family putative adaptor protein [Alphaproteobacteria bacterium]